MADATFGTKVQGRPAPGWVRGLLIGVAALESLSAIRDFPLLFAAPEQFFGQGLGGWIIAAKLVFSPLASVAALIFSATGRVWSAILALAALILLTWLGDMPSVALHGLDLTGSLPVVLHAIFRIILGATAYRGDRRACDAQGTAGPRDRSGDLANDCRLARRHRVRDRRQHLRLLGIGLRSAADPSSAR